MNLGPEADGILQRLDQLIARGPALDLRSGGCPAWEYVLPGPITVWRVQGDCIELERQYYSEGAYFFDAHGVQIGQLSCYAIQPPHHTTLATFTAWLDELLHQS